MGAVYKLGGFMINFFLNSYNNFLLIAGINLHQEIVRLRSKILFLEGKIDFMADKIEELDQKIENGQ